jgi:hypothetical protein
MNTLLVLLMSVAALLSNPKIQSNPVLLSQAMQISQAVNALVEDSTAVQAETTTPNITSYVAPIVSTPVVEAPVLGAVTDNQPSCSLTGTVTSINPSADVFAGANVELDWTLQNMNPTAGTLLAYSKYGLSYPYAIDGTSTTYSYHPIFKATFGSVSCYAYLPDYWTNDTQFPNVGDVSTSTEPSEYQQFNSIIN